MNVGEFAALLRQYRDAAGMSLRQLATAADVNQGSLSHAESGDHRRRLSADSTARVDAALHAGGALLRAWHQLPSSTSHPTPAPAPNQLPPEPVLLGRDQLLDDLHTVFGQPHPDGEAARPTVVLLTGPGGVGKTALAIRAAHQLTTADEGVLMADLRGWHETHGPRLVADVLQNWLRALGASTAEAGGDLDDLVARWRSLTARRRLVLVLDNARSDQVEPLIPASPDSRIIVTSRDRMITVSGIVNRLSVPPLSTQAAVEVLSLHSGHPHHVIAPLAEPCGGLPLALRVAGEDAGAHWTQEEIVDMAHEFDALPQQTAIDRSTALSYQRLSPDTARAWRLLAHVGDPSLGAAAAALGTSSSQTRGWLHEALRANLLDRSGAQWRYHDLHRGWAVRVSREQDDPDLIAELVRRALLWFLHGLAAADEWFANRDDQPTLVALPDDIDFPTFASYDEAWSWVEARWPSLVPAVNTAVAYGETTLAWQLTAIVFHWAFLAKPWSSWANATRTVLEATRTVDDQLGQAWAHHILSCICGDEGQLDAAATHEHTALELRRYLGERRDTGWSAINLSRWLMARDEPDAAIEPLISETIDAHTEVGIRAGVCLAHAARGQLAARRGDLPAARDHYDTALAELDGLGDPAIDAYVQTGLAEVLVGLGHHERGRELALAADNCADTAGADWFRVSALAVLAETYDPAAERDQLWQALHLATTLADKLGDPREVQLRERLAALDS